MQWHPALGRKQTISRKAAARFLETLSSVLDMVEPRRSAVENRALLAFAQVLERMPECSVKGSVVSPKLFDRKIAAVEATVGSKNLHCSLDDRLHYVRPAGVHEGAESGQLDVHIRLLGERAHAVAPARPTLFRHVFEHAGMFEHEGDVGEGARQRCTILHLAS